VTPPAQLAPPPGVSFDLPVEASLRLPIDRDATSMNGLAAKADRRLCVDALTKTKQPTPHRWTTCDRAARRPHVNPSLAAPPRSGSGPELSRRAPCRPGHLHARAYGHEFLP
jgi:hypothetical protein